LHEIVFREYWILWTLITAVFQEREVLPVGYFASTHKKLFEFHAVLRPFVASAIIVAHHENAARHGCGIKEPPETDGVRRYMCSFYNQPRMTLESGYQSGLWPGWHSVQGFVLIQILCRRRECGQGLLHSRHRLECPSTMKGNPSCDEYNSQRRVSGHS